LRYRISFDMFFRMWKVDLMCSKAKLISLTNNEWQNYLSKILTCLVFEDLIEFVFRIDSIWIIQLKCFHFSILLFGWSNRKVKCHLCWATFINGKFFGPNLKIKIIGQFVKFKNFEGSNYNFWKNRWVNFWFFGNLLGSIWKIEDQNVKFEKL